MCSGQVVVSVKVVWLHILHIASGINEAVRWDGHCTPIVVDKEAEGVPLVRVTLSFKGITCCFQIDLFIGHKVPNLVWGIEAGLDAVDHKFYVDISDLLMLVICLEDEKNGCRPTELKGALQHEGGINTLSDKSPQAVKRDALHAEGLQYGAEANVPQVESVLALDGIPQDGALVIQLQKNVVKVKCGHLKDKWEDYCKSKQCGIRGLLCTKER